MSLVNVGVGRSVGQQDNYVESDRRVDIHACVCGRLVMTGGFDST